MPSASDLIILSIALLRNIYSNVIILFLKLHMYHCFTLLCFTVSVFWQFSVVSCLNISSICPNHCFSIQNIFTLWWLSTSWVQQISAHLGWRLSKKDIGVPLFYFLKSWLTLLIWKCSNLDFMIVEEKPDLSAWASSLPDPILIIFILLFHCMNQKYLCTLHPQ